MLRLTQKILAGLAGIMIMTTTATAEVGRPSDLQLSAPGADVPEHCAAFFSPNGWGKGRWNNNRDGELWVEEVRADCSVTAVYSWGEYNEWGPGYKRVSGAKVKADGKLYVPLIFSSMRAEATFTLINGGSQLQGHWYRTDGVDIEAHVVFENNVHNAPQLTAVR